MLERIPHDILFAIFEWVDLPDLVRCRCLSRSFRHIIDTHIPSREDLLVANTATLRPCQRKDIAAIRDAVRRCNFRMLRWWWDHGWKDTVVIQGVKVAVTCANERVMRWLMDHEGPMTMHWMCAAARAGFLDWVKKFSTMKRGPLIWSGVLNSAIQGGHIHIIRWIMEEKEPFSDKIIWEWAGQSGNLVTIRWLIERYGPHHDKAMANGATKGGHLFLIRWLSDRGVNKWDCCIHSATLNGHLPLVEWFESRGVNVEADFMPGVAASGYVFMMRHLAIRVNPDWNDALLIAATCGHLEATLYAIDQGAQNIHEAMYGAITRHLDYAVVEYFVTKRIDLHRFAHYACQQDSDNDHEILNLFLPGVEIPVPEDYPRFLKGEDMIVWWLDRYREYVEKERT